MTPAATMSDRDLVARYFEMGLRPVFWPMNGDSKGPRREGWQKERQTLADYHEGDRVGLLTGIEVAPGQFNVDVDLDWAPGSAIAFALLPETRFAYGRESKRISHCFYTTPEALPSVEYRDIDNSMLIELRGTKRDGTVGLQSMAPPSPWSKNGQRESLSFVSFDGFVFIADAKYLPRRTCLSAIGMLLAKHLGVNGFGHEVRLAWAGFLLRADLTVEEVVAMGEAMSDYYCNNDEVQDVRRVVTSTVDALATGKKSVKGGPTLAKLIGSNGRKIIARINEWLGRDTDFLRDKNGVIAKDSQENIRRAVNLLNVTLSNDEFAERMLIQDDDGPVCHLEDAQVEELWLRIDRECRFRPAERFFGVVINSLARENTFHPVRDYLNSLTWDGEPRINTWLVVYGGAEDRPADGRPPRSDSDDSLSYLEAVSALPLMAAVKRIFERCPRRSRATIQPRHVRHPSERALERPTDPPW